MTAISIISFLIMLYGIAGLIVFYFSKKQKSLPLFKPSIILGAVVWMLASFIVQIGGQDAGVLVTPSGVSDDELHTGWHVVAPWNSLHLMDKTVWVYTCSHNVKEGQKVDADAIWSPTKDGIKMGFDVSVSWRIDPTEASWIYANITENDDSKTSGRYLWLEENVIRPKLKSAMALTVCTYSPIEAYSTKRQDIQDGIIRRMKAECKSYKIIIEQVDLREVFYNPEFEKAINAKKLAEQEVLRLVEVTRQKEEQLKQSSIDKDIAIQQAEGEAKSLQIKGTSIAQNPKIIDLEWINKWDGQLPTYMMGEGKGVIMNLNNK